MLDEILRPPTGLRVRDGSHRENLYLCWRDLPEGRCGKPAVSDIGLCGDCLVWYTSGELAETSPRTLRETLACPMPPHAVPGDYDWCWKDDCKRWVRKVPGLCDEHRAELTAGEPE